VATSIAAFIGYFSRGPMNEAVRIFNREDFNREFGGLRADSLAAYAIEQFFLNGGNQAWVTRTAAGAFETAAVILGDTTPAGSLRAGAANAGAWGNNLRIEVDYGTTAPQPTPEAFNLTVHEVIEGEIVNTESFLNLGMDSSLPNYAPAVINDGSRFIRVEQLADPLPAPTGTVSRLLNQGNFGDLDLTLGLDVDLNGAIASVTLGSIPTTLPALAAAIQAAIRAVPDEALRTVTARAVGSLAAGGYIQVTAGTDDPSDVVQLSGDLAGGAPAGLDFVNNIQQYALGGGSAGTQIGADGGAAQEGNDGTLPGADELIAALAAFDPVDLINILCIPDTDQLTDDDAFDVASQATAYAQSRRAFYILDYPNADSTRDEVPEIEGWLDSNANLRSANNAAYFPRPRIPDSLNENRLRAVPASGTIAGLYARIDGERGVWKAPAGLEAGLRGVRALELKMTDDQNGVLNPLGINALRTFRTAGTVCWGARTLEGADLLASEWKYVPVRRLALFLEESLFRGTQFAVFEPNDEPLWAQIRLNIGAFMQNLFRQGAFQGKTPREAYLVKCDSETTTQNDINLGIVNIVVGFAPLKPAEFVIIKIQQLAGQIQT
jgi:phage tail sheath protein FI